MTIVATEFLESTINTLEYHQRLVDRAIVQLPDEKLHLKLDEHTNSIAVNMKHIAGNLLSRWTDFLTTDGEKEWRNRDQEFIDDFNSRAELLEYWNRGWTCLYGALTNLAPVDMEMFVPIRGERHSIPLAIQRTLGHTCYHVGQIVQLARYHAGDNWETLSIAVGESEKFNRENWGDMKPSGN